MMETIGIQQQPQHPARHNIDKLQSSLHVPQPQQHHAQHQNGPRVSFNRDVHVKRIGKRPNETTNYPIQTTNLQPPETSHLRREPPTDLSEASILREAALVLAQAERVNCSTTIDNLDKTTNKLKSTNSTNSSSNKQLLNNTTNHSKKLTTIPNKFHSLPSRKKAKTTKPVSRSVSDVSAKKSKKPSIFSLFSRKSDTNLNQIEEDLRFKESGGRRLIRSKSDAVETVHSKDKKNQRKRNINENDEQITNNPIKSTQLSPIIENSLSEDYFEKSFQKHHHPLQNLNSNSDQNKIPKLKDSKPMKIVNSENNSSQFYVNNNTIPATSSSVSPAKTLIGNRETAAASVAVNYPRSFGDMHSSQLPPEKPPLTKGLTVDGMVKRLSMERFSPPPTISAPAFSYTRPNDQPIIYAQLAPDIDEQMMRIRSPSKEILMDSSPLHRTTLRLNPQTSNYNYNNRNSSSGGGGGDISYHEAFPSQSKKSEVYINGNHNQHNNSHNLDTLTRSRNHHHHPHVTSHINGIQITPSPQQWQRISPRNLSDDDEGLGFEPRKYFEDELATSPSNMADYQQFRSRAYERSKSPSFDPPIVPVIRNSSPPPSPPPIITTTIHNRGRADGMDSRRREIFHEHFDDINKLSSRRAALESKIRSRKFHVDPEPEITINHNHNHNHNLDYGYSPERSNNTNIQYDRQHHQQYLTPERDNFHHKFHKLKSSEIVNKYSPERTHLDMISPTPKKDMKTSRYTHTKYYDDGSGGIKEIYEKQTQIDDQGKAHTQETRRRERLEESPSRSTRSKDPLIGMAERYRFDCGEPKSLESQFSDIHQSSPENIKRTDNLRMHDENWQSSLKRDKRQQRSFDKGDSGIENDYRKESFNGDLTSRWRKRTFIDDIKSCELFIKKERHHTEELHPQRKKYDFVFRERSIDDGSHFDPRLDKYPKEISRRSKETTIDHHKHQQQQLSSPKTKESLINGIDNVTGSTITTTATTTTNPNTTLKREKKIGGFERVKKLFSSGRKKENKEIGNNHKNNNSTLGKDRYMVKEEEMRSRYLQYSGPEDKESKVIDISTRRRLSTPKASPLLKRMSSDKTTNSSSRPSPLSLKNETETKAEKSGWFKSLDRKSKKKSNEKLGSSSFRTTTDEDFSTLRPTKKQQYRQPPPPPQPLMPTLNGKNLRFFGDTDQESNSPSISRGTNTKTRIRPVVNKTPAKLTATQKYSQSAYDLDRISKKPSANRIRSSSLQNLEDSIDEVDHQKRTRHHSRSRNLHNISESGSETEEHDRKMRHPSTIKTPINQRIEKNHHTYGDYSYRRSDERDSRSPYRDTNDPTRIEFRKPPPGPPKPARSAERSRTQSYSRERERLHDSSGTEGDSSLHSQRSVVYLHATTVGAIPQPYSASISTKRRTPSREDINMKNAQQPMTRSVSRSVSMLAPWTPKHIHDGYEINYSQDSPEKLKASSTMPRKHYSNSGNSLARSRKTELGSRSKKNVSSKEDLSSIRNSSITSASKSNLSSNIHRPYEKRSTDNRREINTLGRRRGK